MQLNTGECLQIMSSVNGHPLLTLALVFIGMKLLGWIDQDANDTSVNVAIIWVISEYLMVTICNRSSRLVILNCGSLSSSFTLSRVCDSQCC